MMRAKRVAYQLGNKFYERKKIAICDYFDNNICTLKDYRVNTVKCHDIYSLILAQKMSIFSTIL